MPHDILLKQDKGVHIESKQGKVFSHKVVNSAWAVKSLYLLVRKCSRPKTYSYADKWDSKDCAGGCLSRQKSCRIHAHESHLWYSKIMVAKLREATLHSNSYWSDNVWDSTSLLISYFIRVLSNKTIYGRKYSGQQDWKFR